MPNHTRGPWRTITLASNCDSRMKAYGIAYGRSGNRLAIVDGEGNSSHDNAANAAVIAAAPDLLDAALAATTSSLFGEGGELIAIPRAGYDALLAAITKATRTP